MGKLITLREYFGKIYDFPKFKINKFRKFNNNTEMKSSDYVKETTENDCLERKSKPFFHDNDVDH